MIRADTELIARLYRRGVPASGIAPLVGCTSRTVQRHVVAMGLRAPDPRAALRFNEGRRAAALALFDQGLSQNEVSATLGVGTQTLNRHLPGYGWTREQSAQHSVAVRRFNQAIKKVWS